jgi:2-oxoglutarate ferredoxin oxidoreductase subunit gamma
MTERVIIAGYGGQGVMLLGKILAEACMREGKFVTWLPSYGPEVRGGTSHNMTIISDKEIGSPYVEYADTLIIMNSPSLERFKGRIKKGGLLIVNSSLAPEYSNRNLRILRHPFTDMALKLGNIKVANMVALGCFMARKNIVSINSVYSVMEDIAPEEKKGLIEINKKALRGGGRLK